jgi:hypothetical protein
VRAIAIEDERSRDPPLVALPEIDRAAVFERVPVSGSALRRPHSAVRLGLGSELEPTADVHHRRAGGGQVAQQLVRLANGYRDGGWPAEVDADAFTAPCSAPSAAPPPWHLYRFTFHTAFGVATAEPHGASRWRFDS